MFLSRPEFYREIHAYHQATAPQKENACGAFALTCLLRGLGWGVCQGAEITPDLTAYHAGMVALEDDYPYDADPGTALQHQWGFARSYTHPLRRTRELAEVGTSPEGMVRAAEALTGGAWTALPVRGRRLDRAPLTEADVWGVVDCLLDRRNAVWAAQVLFNYQTGYLAALEGPGQGWGDVLFGEGVRPCAWDVGHVTSLAGVVSTRDGTRALVIRDSSVAFGWRGYHPERPAAVAAALARSDGPQGGMLVVCRRMHRNPVLAALLEAAPELDYSLWDNGCRFVPPPADP